MPTTYGGGMAAYAGVKPKKTTPANTSLGNKPSGVSSTVAGTTLPWYMNPSANARPDTQYWWQPQLDQSRTLTPSEQSSMQMGLVTGGQPGAPQSPALFANTGSGRSGGGAAVGGLDQATLDWIMGQIGAGRPQDLIANPLDLPDPSQYYGNFDTSQYDTARQGVTSGLAGVQGRANTAYDNAQAQLNQFQNPYASAAWATNPAMSDRMSAMFAANGVPTSVNADTQDQGVQADRAFGNVNALMAANEQARQAANNRALAGDRQTTEQNVGIEGNMLNLGVNMAQARGQSAWDQMLKQAQYDAANTEASQNWQRGNTVSDTNVGNKNQWNQGILNQLLAIIGAKAPGTTLPTNTAAFYAS